MVRILFFAMAIICIPFGDAFATSANGCAFVERKEMPNGAGSDWAKLHEKSLSLINKGERIEAMEIAEKALQVAEKNSGTFHPDVATSLKRIASIHLLTGGDADKAEPLLRRALSIYEKSFGPESLYAADMHYVLSEYYLQKRNHQDSDRHFSIFADIYLRSLEENAFDLLAVYNLLASRLIAKGEYPNALSMYRKSLEINERCMGHDSDHVAINLSGIARALEGMRAYDDAEVNLRQAIEIRERIAGAESEGVAIYLVQLAGLYRANGRFEEAEELYARVATINAKQRK
jgi:tetratricopeptide (TPR) repeat protein